MKTLLLSAAALLAWAPYALAAEPEAQPTPPRKTIALPGGKAPAIPPGPFAPTWESIAQNYQTPEWFRDAKFGLFMHWGLYSVPAHFSEWYPRHMYASKGPIAWHAEHYGPQDVFGYKDFIPLFKAEKYDPAAWAELFKKSGAKYVVPTAEHHDGFALYDSKLTKWDAKDMGPRRDLIGDLAKAVRAQGLKFGVSNHRMENWDFMYPAAGLKTDLFDPRYADFYGPPQKPQPQGAKLQSAKPAPGVEMVDDPAAPQSAAFLEEWLARNEELVDKYQPDLVWFDNGVNPRKLDPYKLRFAAYYYNRASAWGKQVSISTKSDAYLAGSIKDYERQGRAPHETQAQPWQVDDPIGDKFGYVEGMGLQTPQTIVTRLVQNVARNGGLLLNISPRADGTIPEEQQKILLAVGAWLDVNGEAIYATRPWIHDSEGTVFFTQKAKTLYATALAWPSEPLVITALPLNVGKVGKVTLLGGGPLTFRQNDQGLIVEFPAAPVGQYAYALKIEGLEPGKIER